MTRVLVAVGSNLEPERNLSRALSQLQERYGPIRVSRAYRNCAYGFAGPDFINLAVSFETECELSDVVSELRAIEIRCGRKPQAPKWASRVIDLDVLLFGELVQQGEDVKVPRPCLLKRAYMLGPAAEIAGDLTHPLLDKTLAELWADFDRSSHPLIPVRLDFIGQDFTEQVAVDSASTRPPSSK